jgi:hypothetical protein
MANSRAIVGLFVSAFMLVACTREVVIDIARKGGAIAFVASRPEGDPPCIQGVIVTLAGADIAVAPSLWEVSTAEPGRCRTSFTYGETPTGYAQSGPAPRLLVGSRYLVEISGPGLLGGREFTLRADDGPMGDEGPR